MSNVLQHKHLHIYMVFVMGNSVIICCIQVSDVNRHYLFCTLENMYFIYMGPCIVN